MIGPIISGGERELFTGIPASSFVRSKNFSQIKHELSGKIVHKVEKQAEHPTYRGISDENRGVIFPEIVMELDGMGYALSIKGVGARTPAYGASPADFIFRRDFGCDDDSLIGARMFTDELWFGDEPYGAQGEINTMYSLEITEMARGCSINGFHICPVVEINEMPEELAHRARQIFWYRRYRGRLLQEQRLIPSNIRLYHHSDTTLGKNIIGTLKAFGITTCEEMDSFIENYTSSGVAALTLFVRSLKKTKRAFQGLDYDNVWLDKDSVLSRDGTLHFADLEGLEWYTYTDRSELEKRIRRQLDWNFYEFMYGVDMLARERERAASRYLTQSDRRADVSTRFELALANDRFIRCEQSLNGLDIVIKHPEIRMDEIPIRLIDMR